MKTCRLQIENKDQASYSTGKPFTHPSERRQLKRLCPGSHRSAQRNLIVPKLAQTHPITANTSWKNEDAASTNTRKYNLTGVAKLSLHETAKVYHQLSGKGIELSNPCQLAIHKNSGILDSRIHIYTAAKVKKHLVSRLHREK